MKTLKKWLILRDGEYLRVVSKNPSSGILPNEIAFELNLKVPQPPRIAAVIDIELPEAPPVDAANITVEEWIVGDRAAKRAEATRERLDK